MKQEDKDLEYIIDDDDDVLVTLITTLQVELYDDFNFIYDALIRNGKFIDEKIRTKMFNAVCQSYSESIVDLEKLDKKINISQYMMQKVSGIDVQNLLSSSSVKLIKPPVYKSPKEELEDIFQEHGFIFAARKGRNDIVDYLLSLKLDISPKLLECAFITACKENHFDIALKISSRIKTMNDSKLINEAMKITFNEKQKEFVSILMLKDKLKNELGNSPDATKKAKFKVIKVKNFYIKYV